MTIKLTSSFGGTIDSEDNIEINTPSRILQDFIKENWPADPEDEDWEGLPAATKIDFGGFPNRTNKAITLRTYPIIYMERMLLGGQDYQYRVPVAIDVFVRDNTAEAQRREPTSLVKIQQYLQEFLKVNRLGLRSKGINNMSITEVNPLGRDQDNEGDQAWWHSVISVVLNYWMRLRDV